MSYGIALERQGIALEGAAVDGASSVSVALCGSFRRDPGGLKREYNELIDAGCTVLSPVDIEWVAERDGFVLAEHEVDEEPCRVEAAHLSAMRSADFVWLYTPNGYVGHSASMELGYAHALGLAIYARNYPDDVMLSGLVRKVDSAEEAIADARSVRAAPTLGLDALQSYYARAAATRGWINESAGECLALLTEEVGELFRAVREGGAHSTAAALEMADVQLYLVQLANIAEIDLGQAVIV